MTGPKSQGRDASSIKSTSTTGIILSTSQLMPASLQLPSPWVLGLPQPANANSTRHPLVTGTTTITTTTTTRNQRDSTIGPITAYIPDNQTRHTSFTASGTTTINNHDMHDR